MSDYMVSQYNHGAEHRWIFSEPMLSEQVYNNGPVPDKDEVPYWPIGGSNSSYSVIRKAESDEDIRQFLTSPGDGPDLEDPMLIDIAEYYCSVDILDAWCMESYTAETMQRLGIPHPEDTFDERYGEAKKMVKGLQHAGYTDFDYDDPFYGKNRDMRYSELCDLYEEVVRNE